MTTGRPSLYTPELLEKARAYLDGYEKLGDKVPSVAGLACMIGVVRETCHVWANDPEKGEFSNILKELAQKQERALLNKGLSGEFNPPITKMMLSKHGYSDRIEADHTSSDRSMSPKAGVDLSKAPPELLEWIVAQGDASRPE
jgi:hypothetical protein